MRVCMFAMLLPVHVTGGMELHSMELARGVAAEGHEVTVITTRHPGGLEHETAGGVEIYYVDEPATSRMPMGAKAVRKFEELHAARGFDVVHSQSFAAFRYVNGLKDRLKVPLVTTIHGTYSNSIRSHLNQGLTPALPLKVAYHIFCHYRWSRGLVRGSDAVIAVSDEIACKIPREFKIVSKKVKTVYNGVDADAFRPRECRLKAGYGDVRVVLSVSVLHRQKGVQNLIKACGTVRESVPDAHLIVVGDGPYRKSLERLAGELKADVTFTGKVDYGELPEYYNLCDVCVIPTIAAEGLPMVELEAMACGKPVIASDIGGIPTAIRDGVDGLLVKPGDVGELAAKITKVLGDGKLAAGLGSNARAAVERKFSRRRMVEDTIKVYGEAAGK